MATKEQVRESLRSVLIPHVMRSVEGLNLIRNINIDNHRIKITLASAALSNATQDLIKSEVKEILKKLPEIDDVQVEYIDIEVKGLNIIHNIKT